MLEGTGALQLGRQRVEHRSHFTDDALLVLRASPSYALLEESDPVEEGDKVEGG